MCILELHLVWIQHTPTPTANSFRYQIVCLFSFHFSLVALCVYAGIGFTSTESSETQPNKWSKGRSNENENFPCICIHRLFLLFVQNVKATCRKKREMITSDSSNNCELERKNCVHLLWLSSLAAAVCLVVANLWAHCLFANWQLLLCVFCSCFYLSTTHFFHHT